MGNDATALNLFQQFCIHELTTNMWAADCTTHTSRVAAFRKLPSTYPSEQKWSAEDNNHYQPITKDILKGITQELTSEDIKQDPN